MITNYDNNIFNNILKIKNNKFFLPKIKQNINLYKLIKYLEKYNNNQSTYYYTKILFYNNKIQMSSGNNFNGGAGGTYSYNCYDLGNSPFNFSIIPTIPTILRRSLNSLLNSLFESGKYNKPRIDGSPTQNDNHTGKNDTLTGKDKRNLYAKAITDFTNAPITEMISIESLQSFLQSFLKSLIKLPIKYYFVQRLIFNSDDIVGKDQYFYRYWYFQKFNINDNIKLLELWGCNCIDLINLCRIQFNRFPVYFKNLTQQDNLTNSLAVNDMNINQIYEQCEIGSIPKLHSRFNIFDFGSYQIWYYYFVTKSKLSKPNYKITNMKMYRALSVGTLLLSHDDSRRQHTAIVYSITEGDINIVHCWPNNTYNSDSADEISFNGLCNPGIKCEKLIDVLCEWQDLFTTEGGNNDLFFYFNLAIPIEDWLNEKDLNFAVLDIPNPYSESIDLYKKYTTSKEDSIEDQKVLEIYNKYLNRPSQEKTLDNMNEYLITIKEAIKKAYDES